MTVQSKSNTKMLLLIRFPKVSITEDNYDYKMIA